MEEVQGSSFENQDGISNHESYDESDSSSSGESQDEKWSLSVKINSLVDMPSNIAPSIPFCPVIKVGLITIHDPKELQELEMSSALLRRADYEQSNDDALKKLPQASLALSAGVLADFQNHKSLVHCDTVGQVKYSSGKILSKKDNGMMEWHEEMRWDDVELPLQTVVAIELSTRAILPSPTANASSSSGFGYDTKDDKLKITSDIPSTVSTITSSHDDLEVEELKGFRALWRKGRQTLAERRIRSISGHSLPMRDGNAHERMEHANKAAIEAQYLIGDKEDGEQSDKFVSEEKTEEKEEEEEMRIGTIIIPIANLPLEDEIPKVEKWYKFDALTNKTSTIRDDGTEKRSLSFRDPSALLEICLSMPETLDAVENETFGIKESQFFDPNLIVIIPAESVADSGDQPAILKHDIDTSIPVTKKKESLSVTDNMKDEEIEAIKQNGPYLEQGIIDYVCVVGPKDIGNVRIAKDKLGWLENDPECDILEQFPADDVHKSNGRNCSLPNKIEWWCFPEGCKLWRGVEPPTHMNMNIKRFSASSPPAMASSIAAFDACLNCTSSFMWWVLSSNSDEYGSSINKTYGAVIRFYAPVPSVETNDDDEGNSNKNSEVKLWCPLGICMTSNLPIIGVMEALLLRLCEKLAASGGLRSAIHSDIMSLILNYQRPIPSTLNCTIPFLSGDGERLLISLPPIGGLPPLPHGASLTSVCRLLGAEGLTALLAAVLTECKILIHSADITNLSMVGEVITSLMYPFQWQHPFIPVLPVSMLEMVEAPLSYFIGVPSCNMKWIDKTALVDVVVVDLDNGFSSSDYFDGRRNNDESIAPTPLPAAVSSNISKATFRLLREDEELQEEYGTSHFSDSNHLPRLEGETLAEREFRVTLAHQICSLIRGYQECLFFVSASQPVFNRDRFLRQAPALFEERIIPPSVTSEQMSPTLNNQKMLSPRSKRFLSGLVNSQHFHQLLERLDSEIYNFFHEIMESYPKQDEDDYLATAYGTPRHRDTINRLRESLQMIEDNITTYHVHDNIITLSENINDAFDAMMIQNDDFSYFSSFTSTLLKPVVTSNRKLLTEEVKFTGIQVGDNIQKSPQMSLQEIVELERHPWVYQELFNIDILALQKESPSILGGKIHLKEVLGERKFNAWKQAQKAKHCTSEHNEEDKAFPKNHHKSVLDLTKLIGNVRSDEMAEESKRNIGRRFSQRHVTAVDERAIIKRFIERAYEIAEEQNEDIDYVTHPALLEMDTAVENAMKNPSAQKFLISVLSQRSRLQNDHRTSGTSSEVGTSRLHQLVFDCLYKLCRIMLETCVREKDYESAYRLIIHTTGFCTVDKQMQIEYMTKRLARHKIYSNMRLWDKVLLIHQHDRQRDKQTEKIVESNESDQYEAAVSTLYEMLGYGMPADTLARFASRVANQKFRSTDREQKLLTLARRLAVKCEDAISEDQDIDHEKNDGILRSNEDNKKICSRWDQIKWSHPSADTSLGNSTPITALSCVSSSIIVSGGLDGSIFVANPYINPNQSNGAGTLKGFRLEIRDSHSLSSIGTSFHDETFIGAISCLATSAGAESDQDSFPNEPNLQSYDFEGYQLVAGTNGGILNVWDLESVLREDDGVDSTVPVHDIQIHSSGNSSAHVRRKKSESKYGRALGGHRGGVTCMSIPPKIYRPDSLISGGNDGLIKLWSLRPPVGRSNARNTVGARTSRSLFSGGMRRASETLDVLAGHGGRILCAETAWHGDRLLTGAADKTLKLWDMASQSGGRCIHTMQSHSGWVTHCKFWGRNTVLSASTDRCMALWDTRTMGAPQCILKAHNGPISDLYLESRNTNWMSSAGADGKIVTWDFRMMKTIHDKNELNTNLESKTRICREPMAEMHHCSNISGPVFLAKGMVSSGNKRNKYIMSASVDGWIREWNAVTGTLVNAYETSHKRKISCFETFEQNIANKGTISGTVTAAWDGTVEYRVLKKE